MQSKEGNVETGAREIKERQAGDKGYLPEMRNQDV
jgi:hypothetical protein